MTIPHPKPLLVAGVMSGTSADGIDVALCRISPALRRDTTPRLKLLGYKSFAYDKKLRATILNIAAGNNTTAAELTQLSWHLGNLYADCIATTATALNLKPQLAAIHGQTIYHQAAPTKFLGSPIRCTSQIGEPALIAERLRIPVISDFRPADLAAGGQGAPLVPMLDFTLFRHATRNRVLLNLGGIANVTALPAACTTADVLAFDTGPGNLVMDGLTKALTGELFDAGGALAAQGSVDETLLAELLAHPYFALPPPKSTGAEMFNARYAADLMERGARLSPADLLATAAQLTVESIAQALRDFLPRLPHRLIAAGGGVRNKILMTRLSDVLPDLPIDTTQALGIPPDARESLAFALLAAATLHRIPANVPTATGASGPRLLGSITYP